MRESSALPLLAERITWYRAALDYLIMLMAKPVLIC